MRAPILLASLSLSLLAQPAWAQPATEDQLPLPAAGAAAPNPEPRAAESALFGRGTGAATGARIEAAQPPPPPHGRWWDRFLDSFAFHGYSFALSRR